MVSPGKCVNILLDSLKVKHIANIIHFHGVALGNIFIFTADFYESAGEEQEVAALIHKRTGGVPRFITYAIDLLKSNPSKKYEELMGKPFEDKVKKEAENELMPWKNLTPQGLDMYVEFLRMAVLKIPIVSNDLYTNTSN